MTLIICLNLPKILNCVAWVFGFSSGWSMALIFLVLFLISLGFSDGVDIQRGPENPYAETSKCELIRIPACQGLPYNTTILPNIMGHTSQEEAGQDITQYNSLVKIPCSPSLKLFLCSLYFPVCTQLHKPLPPCRSLCEQNRHRCEPIMRSFSFQVKCKLHFLIKSHSGLPACSVKTSQKMVYAFLKTNLKQRRQWKQLWNVQKKWGLVFYLLVSIISYFLGPI